MEYIMGINKYMEEIPFLLEVYSDFGKKTMVLDHNVEWEKIQNDYNLIVMEKRGRRLWTGLKNKIRSHDITIINKKGIINPCRDCNSNNNLEIHHEGYFKDRQIVILCKLCHIKRHSKQ